MMKKTPGPWIPVGDLLELKELFVKWAALPDEQKNLFAEWQAELRELWHQAVVITEGGTAALDRVTDGTVLGPK